MPRFQSDGLSLAYQEDGQGIPILLIHGFASTAMVNWVNTGWVELLAKAGRRVIAIDVRGHGDSDKPHDPAQYTAPIMAEDARRLLDHLDIAAADVMGYSMGARIATFLALAHPERVRSLILAGMAYRLIESTGSPEYIAAAMEAPSLADVADERGQAFRKFADQNGADLKALAACIRGPRVRIDREEIGRRLTMPVLVAVGTEDTVAGSPQALAELLPDAEVLEIPNRDHMRTVGDKVYKAGVADFLERRSGPANP
jgi:pimeloyl-ACP methyl ester carboxylesterase